MELTVTLPHKEYDLWIQKNALDDVGTWVTSKWSKRKIAIITDETVEELYGQKVLSSIKEAGFDAYIVSVPSGETSKSLRMAESLYESLASKEMTRNDGIIALGGGVVGDLAGFVASTYMRGLCFLQIPTTLLAQVDSSIGGKTAVNTQTAKNLVGTFAQPDGVLIDPNTLHTLEPRRIREGLAEVVKSAAIGDTKLWTLLDSIEDDSKALEQSEAIITACCQVKRLVVEEDELDTGNRLLLNFGHTIGHAIEQTVGYGIITHGEAVSIGMCHISKMAEKKGEMPLGITEKLEQMLQKFHLPVMLDEWNTEALYQALTHDKKTRGDEIKIILLDEIGLAKIKKIPIVEMKEYLKGD
ncbi:MAG: 3-dehydroquinate synthase [Vagococcus sp.]